MSWLPWSWQSPQWLWLLLALLIPLLIHLLQRSAPREITFAAAHWLQQRQPQSWKRLQLRDTGLLCLRLLLLALLAALLAIPLLQQRENTGALLLVDPAVEPAELAAFSEAQGPFARVLWLQPRPQPVASSSPESRDSWNSLSALAAEPRYRHAHILLDTGASAAGYRALRYSPHWQWHRTGENTPAAPPAPPMAIMGEAPPWLGPALQELAETGTAQLEPQALADPGQLDPQQFQWLLYNRPGPLPEAVQAFVRAGGLLVSDSSVTPAGTLDFVPLGGDGGPAREAAALGRGSWLRYRGNWQDEAFYRRTDLPALLWQQWSQQDWPLQAQLQPHWPAGKPPGIPVADSEVAAAAREPLQQPLLLALLLVLLAERALTLSRRQVHG
ncbi:BatA domain-containing protein [Microbulbifer zhoushanensis]|uniref:BatA domain-containing protein n=1 Tax=Microbulbifer zhoushanensis TaxID=2904254 RepID=UPI001F31E72D|nr:BatA domain-containing protein [Microbulbifer zhoushanensis]